VALPVACNASHLHPKRQCALPHSGKHCISIFFISADDEDLDEEEEDREELEDRVRFFEFSLFPVEY
jgi:hypothetical protein